MINGNEYSWEDLQIIIEGKSSPIEGVTGIEYTTSKDHQNIYGRGDEPVAMGRGKKEFEGKITLLQSEFEALQQGLPKGKDVTDLKAFGITVAYAPEAGVATVDQLNYVRIKKFKKGMVTGDGNQTIECELAIGKIIYNV